MKANYDKCRLFLSSLEEDAAIQIEELRIKCSNVTKLVRILATHVDTIFKKAHRKLTVLSRINYMEFNKRHILMNAFFKAQFNYCAIIWMFHSSSLNTKINRLHERRLPTMTNCLILKKS